MVNQDKSINSLTEDEQRQYDALMTALNGGAKRDTLHNNSLKFSKKNELAIQKSAANSPILKKFWNL